MNIVRPLDAWRNDQVGDQMFKIIIRKIEIHRNTYLIEKNLMRNIETRIL